jgi:MFS family permease
MVSTALPTMANELKGEDIATWVGTAFLLTSTAIAPLWGKLGDIFGRKNLLILNIVIFILASILCARAPTMLILIIGRGIQGVGGGGLQSLVMVLISDVVTLAERGTYQGVMSGITGVCFITGPLLGGVVSIVRRRASCRRIQDLDDNAVFEISDTRTIPLSLLASPFARCARELRWPSLPLFRAI